ncbi:MAG: hypothetical protein E3J56_12005 [Candidatus Aminicenantes bacterium]|nr:MAG: hypothetical protein E3J56_12005 [Candidatus Aminicenantes bacterium]
MFYNPLLRRIIHDFNVGQRKARKGRNPQTSEESEIKAKKVAKFVPRLERALRNSHLDTDHGGRVTNGPESINFTPDLTSACSI